MWLPNIYTQMLSESKRTNKKKIKYKIHKCLPIVDYILLTTRGSLNLHASWEHEVELSCDLHVPVMLKSESLHAYVMALILYHRNQA